MTPSERNERVEGALLNAKQRAGWWRAPCPFCEGSGPTFSFNPSTGYWHCFRCRERGVLGGAFALLLGDGAPKEATPEELREALNPPESFELLAGNTDRWLAPARDYLHKRGIPEDVWAAAQVGACTEGKFRTRIVIPNLLHDGSWRGYTTRTWDPKCPSKFKYRYPPGNWRQGLVHNVPALASHPDELLYVVEGAFDVLALWPHAVGAMGLPAEHQIPLLAACPRPLAVVLDGDAWEAGWVFAMKLRMEGACAGAVRLAPGDDPDDVDSEWLWEEARASLGKLGD